MAFKRDLIAAFCFLLVGCQATQAPAYQANKSPEERTQYNGLDGVIQQQKDQNYLLSKELKDKCDKARIDLAVAQRERNDESVSIHEGTIEKTCR